jgi:uncharacterized membrane protein required for colicin V production
MGISWLDGLLAVVVVLLVLWEIRRDLGQSIFDTVSLLIGLRLALSLGPSLAGRLGMAHPNQAQAVALVLTFLVGAGAGLVGGFYLNALTRWTLDSFDRVAGVLLGLSGAVIVCHVLVAALALYFGSHAGPPAFIAASPLGHEALSFHTFHEVLDFFNRLHT